MVGEKSSVKKIRKLLKRRYSLFFAGVGLYIILSFLVRLSLFFWTIGEADLNPLSILRVFLQGFVFDLAAGLGYFILYLVYLLLMPKRWTGSVIDKILTWFYFIIVWIIIYFGLVAEFPFWEEFQNRFNFIAVDYLIYTNEVISNINQSYPLPLIIGGLILATAFTLFLFYRLKVLKNTFSGKTPFAKRLLYSGSSLVAAFLLLFFMKNNFAEQGNNRVMNELSKNGTFSFFAAYRSNELNYAQFYPVINDQKAFGILRKNLLQENQTYDSNGWNQISRFTKGGEEIHPNIILITIESFSAAFLKAFGDTNNLTPNYDSLANHSIFLTNLYATGTRTVRGMEALTLSIPPTPGNSIVRRLNNDNLFSIATILRPRDYQMKFLYGGDGYFDNMNSFFSGQGFDIVDRYRGYALPDEIKTHRYNIPNKDVTFENAWGICDEDLYNQSIKYADLASVSGKPFFQFIMTTSNHRPYTFPSGKIDLPQGTRNAAVKYTDYALGKFITEAAQKPWFQNTVFVIVADHCASSAGRWEININQHHIPAIIYNLKNQNPEKIGRLMSQIDLMPTLFGYLHWNYNSEFYGKDINQTTPGSERAFIGNYRTLGIFKNNIFTQIDDLKEIKQFSISKDGKNMVEIKNPGPELSDEAVSYYQTASERFSKGEMKEKSPVSESFPKTGPVFTQ